MKWDEVKKAYPSQWLLIEALDAKTVGEKRIVDEIAIVDTFSNDSQKAMDRYLQLHKQHKERDIMWFIQINPGWI